jgi:hypothetical protein
MQGLRLSPDVSVRVHKIAGVHQNISGGKILYPVVKRVGAGNYHDTHRLSLIFRTKTDSIALDAASVARDSDSRRRWSTASSG